MTIARLAPLLALAALPLLAACQGDLTDAAPLPANLDKAYFDCKVQPILTKSCGALACHGTETRYLRIYSRNRLRLGLKESDRNAFMTPEERTFNFDIARAYVEPGKPKESWLLLKPLAAAKGGYYHGGEDLYKKGNVFLNRDDKDYGVIAAWVNGEKDDPACIEPGSDK